MGDVTHIYDTAGVLKAKYIYDAWGNHIIVTDVDGIATLNPIRYRGYYYDTETGLYYLKARYYDPETGRFISQDDMAYIVSSHLMGLNLYAYCNNNPVKYLDSTGKIPLYNWCEKVSTSKTIFELPFGLESIGKFSLSWTHSKSIEFNRGNKKGFFYAYHNIGYDDYDFKSTTFPYPNGESYGIGINAWNWLGLEVGANTDVNLFVNAQLTPWVQAGLEVGKSGVGVNLSFGGDTTLDVSLNVGWGGIAAVGVILLYVFAPWASLAAAAFI